MDNTVSGSLFALLACQLIRNLSNFEDAEKALHKLGLKLSVPLIQKYVKKRESNFLLAMHQLFTFLDFLYKSPRQIKKVNNIYVLSEEAPLMSRYVTKGHFCADALIGGVIEGYLEANGFSSEVEAHLNEDKGTVYVIKVNVDDASWDE